MKRAIRIELTEPEATLVAMALANMSLLSCGLDAVPAEQLETWRANRLQTVPMMRDVIARIERALTTRLRELPPVCAACGGHHPTEQHR